MSNNSLGISIIFLYHQIREKLQKGNEIDLMNQITVKFKRKGEILPRALRKLVPRGVYHVITRGNNGQKIFLDRQDHQIYLSYLEECKQKYKFLLYLYVLMPNHIHLLLRTSYDEAQSVSVIMRSLNSRYTKYFNAKHARTGHLFHGRFYGELVENDTHLFELTRYIHLNPLRANLVKDVKEFPYSSYLSYVNDTDDDCCDVVDFDEILSLFGKKKATQKERYRKFVEDGVALWRLHVSSRTQERKLC